MQIDKSLLEKYTQKAVYTTLFQNEVNDIFKNYIRSERKK